MQFVIIFKKEMRAPTRKRGQQNTIGSRDASEASPLDARTNPPEPEKFLEPLTLAATVGNQPKPAPVPLVIDTNANKQAPAETIQKTMSVRNVVSSPESLAIPQLEQKGLTSTILNAATQPSNVNATVKYSIMPSCKRETYLMTITGTLAQVRKMQISSEAGMPILAVNLKSWESRR